MFATLRSRLPTIRWDSWWGSPAGKPTFYTKRLVAAFGCVVRLHKFVAADAPGCYHTHPAKAYRLVIWGGYVEELGDGTKVTWRPGMFGLVRPELEHRIDSLLNGKSSWSLWFRGPKVAEINVRGC